MVQRCAVLGHPIEHSLSPVIHQAGYQALGLDWVYERIESTEAQFPEVVAKLANYRGLSVTMPNKFAALRLAASSSERARLIGSANTLVRTNSGWYADNTDGEGLLGALAALGITDLSGQHVLIIGGGGTARPALWAVSELGASTIDVVNRSDKSVELAPLATRHGAEFHFHDFHADLEQLATSSRVVISTVPSSVLTAHVEALAHTSVLDVIYDPWPTPLVELATSRGLPAVGGHIMLAHQAFSQFEQFTGHPAPKEIMLEALTEYLGIS